MKRILTVAGALVILAVTAVVLGGLFIPSEKSFTQETQIDAPAEVVWQVLTDRAKYPEWQDRVKSVEMIDETRWREILEHTDPLNFEITRAEAPRLLELRYSMENGFRGSWRGEIKDLGNSRSAIVTTDRTVTENWLMKMMMPLFFDLEEFAKDWNNKLKTRAEVVARKRNE